jgi:hypothetical protein
MFICKRNLQLETLLPAPLLLPPYQLGGNARLDVLDSILNLISFSAILWSTSQTLTGALAIYDTWWKGCARSLFVNGSEWFNISPASFVWWWGHRRDAESEN